MRTEKKIISLAIPVDLYWRIFREAARRSAKYCRKVSVTSFLLDAARRELARPDGEREE